LTLENPAANLAFNKTATQSSTDWSAPADRAVDGNTDGNFWNGSVTHTQVENQAWWHVDLGSVQTIGRIDVWNRTDCCGDALTNFYVFVSDQPFASTDLTATQNQAGVWNYHNTGQGGTPTSIIVNRTGRYIRVQLVGVERLSLAEVQVWPSQ
jgi:alpha-L-fucosidase 2